MPFLDPSVFTMFCKGEPLFDALEPHVPRVVIGTPPNYSYQPTEGRTRTVPWSTFGKAMWEEDSVPVGMLFKMPWTGHLKKTYGSAIMCENNHRILSAGLMAGAIRFDDAKYHDHADLQQRVVRAAVGPPCCRVSSSLGASGASVGNVLPLSCTASKTHQCRGGKGGV